MNNTTDRAQALLRELASSTKEEGERQILRDRKDRSGGFGEEGKFAVYDHKSEREVFRRFTGEFSFSMRAKSVLDAKFLKREVRAEDIKPDTTGKKTRQNIREN